MAKRIGQINEATFIVKNNFINLGVFGKAALDAINVAQAMLSDNIDKTTTDQLNVIRNVCILPTGEIAFKVNESDLRGWGKNGFAPTSIVKNECKRTADCFIKNKKEALDFLKTRKHPVDVNRILCVHWYIMYRDKDEAIRRFGKNAFGRIDLPYDPFLTERLKEISPKGTRGLKEYMLLIE